MIRLPLGERGKDLARRRRDWARELREHLASLGVEFTGPGSGQTRATACGGSHRVSKPISPEVLERIRHDQRAIELTALAAEAEARQQRRPRPWYLDPYAARVMRLQRQARQEAARERARRTRQNRARTRQRSRERQQRSAQAPPKP